MRTDQGARSRALKDLEVFIGEWSMEASFPSAPATPAPSNSGTPIGADANGGAARTVFEWILDGQFLLQRAEVPGVPAAPDVFAIIGFDLNSEAYSQHYFDSRGVARVYAMTFTDGVWRLHRDAPDFSPLDFRQRFTGRFSDDAKTIDGRWESAGDGSSWEHDFDLTYTKLI